MITVATGPEEVGMELPLGIKPVEIAIFLVFLVICGFQGWDAAEKGRWLLLAAIGAGVVLATLVVLRPRKRELPRTRRWFSISR